MANAINILWQTELVSSTELKLFFDIYNLQYHVELKVNTDFKTNFDNNEKKLE